MMVRGIRTKWERRSGSSSSSSSFSSSPGKSPQVLKALRDAAIIPSAESSNRIEGVTVEPDRLRPLVLGNTRPRDRSEQEVQGYRRALNEIHTRYEKLPITADTLKHLHALCQSASGDAGQFKRVDNEVIQLVPGAAPVIRFRCVKARETPAAVDELLPGHCPSRLR